jgi:hypothetical protein
MTYLQILAAFLYPTVVVVPSQAETVMVMPETVIVGHVPAKHAKTWTCGPVEANAIGGSQRTCEYK